jgi:DNA-binding transcriptional regulator YiaG
MLGFSVIAEASCGPGQSDLCTFCAHQEALFPGPKSTPDQSGDRAERLLPEAVEVIEASPRIGQKALRARLQVGPDVARNVVERAIEVGRVRWGRVDYVDGRGRPRVRQGLFPIRPGENEIDADSGECPIGVGELRELRSKRGLTGLELAKLIAERVGVTVSTAGGWQQKSGVPAAHAREVRELLGAMPEIGEIEFRCAARRQVCEVLSTAPEGISQRRLPRGLPEAMRRLVMGGDLIEEMLDAGVIHERPAPRAAGPGERCVWLFDGPAPVEWEPGPGMDGTEFRDILTVVDLRASHAARLLGISEAMVRGWLSGSYTIPRGMRAQIRGLPRAAPRRG